MGGSLWGGGGRRASHMGLNCVSRGETGSSKGGPAGRCLSSGDPWFCCL